MDRLLREANPPTGQLASPKPQYKKPGEDAYEPVEGQYGAPFAILKNASGQVISPATDAKLEQVKSELELIKSELQTIKANQLSGNQKVQLSGTIVELGGISTTLSISPGSTIEVIPMATRTEYKKIAIRGVIPTGGIPLKVTLRPDFGPVEEIFNGDTTAFSKLVDLVSTRYSVEVTNINATSSFSINRCLVAGIRG